MNPQQKQFNLNIDRALGSALVKSKSSKTKGKPRAEGRGAGAGGEERRGGSKTLLEQWLKSSEVRLMADTQRES